MNPDRGQFWTHVKTGHRYKVLRIAVNATNGCEDQKMVIYRAVRGSETVFVREMNEFTRKFRPVQR